MVKAGEVSEIAITDNAIQGTPRSRWTTAARSSSPPGGTGAGQGAIAIRREAAWSRTPFRDILGWVLPAVIFVGIWIFAMRKFAGQSRAWAAAS